MKKLIVFTITLLLIFNLTSCKKDKQDSTKKNIEVKNYIVDTKNSVINWTAYKTTEKIPVKGVFKEVKINVLNPAANPIEVLKGLEFEIPVASIYSKDSVRDSKLTEFFFGVMKNTINIGGKINIAENGKGNIDLTMNGLTKNLPFTFEVHGDNIELNATMNLDNWQAKTAIEALNVVCNDKHKAADGISKTWNEVALNVQVKTVLEK